MKKKVISLAAVLVLASMMLVMFTGCSGYREIRSCRIAGATSTEYFKVTLRQWYDDNTGYDKNKFQVMVDYEYKSDNYTPGESQKCNYNELSSGIQVKVGTQRPTLYITGVTFDNANKIAYGCNPKCEIRLQGRQFVGYMNVHEG